MPRRTTRTCTALLAVSAALACGAAAAAERADCKPVPVAEWAVRLDRNEVLTDGTLDGEPISVKIDTGSMRTLAFRSTAQRLRLTPRRTRDRVFAIGGEAEIDVAVISELRIGDLVRPGKQLVVAADRDRGDAVDLILGHDFLHRYDVEFDLPHGAVRLFKSGTCATGSPVYWTSYRPREVEIEPVDDVRPQIVLPVRVNDRQLLALLDSGAATTLLSKNDAAAAGVTPETPGVIAVGSVSGLGRKSMTAWVAPFDTIGIGNEVIKGSLLLFTDLYQATTYVPKDSRVPKKVDNRELMLIGVDFLRAHRMLIAHDQRRIYFTYTGGPPFQAPDGGPIFADHAPAVPPDR
jgi:predicted aspartyl protease